MRKLVVKEWMTLDGVFDAETMDQWWTPYDSPERQESILEIYSRGDAYLLGRTLWVGIEGRGTPSRGLDLAALYLETQLRVSGVEPALQNSYLQTYKIGEYKPSEARVNVRVDGQTISPSNYVFFNIGRDPGKGPLDLELVNAGFGIVAEERKVRSLMSLGYLIVFGSLIGLSREAGLPEV